MNCVIFCAFLPRAAICDIMLQFYIPCSHTNTPRTPLQTVWYSGKTLYSVIKYVIVASGVFNPNIECICKYLVQHSTIGYVTIMSSHDLETQRTRMCRATQNSERILRRLQIAASVYNRDLSSVFSTL